MVKIEKKFFEKKAELDDKIRKLILDFQDKEYVKIVEVNIYTNVFNERRVKTIIK